MVEGRWTQLGKDKLESSGLTVKDAQSMGMYELPSAKLLHPNFEALPAIIIPYQGIDGKPISGFPAGPKFYRLRYLAKGNSFTDLATTKSQRYAQPAGTGVCAYFPNLMDWEEIAKDAKHDLVITEGEFKAACACAKDIATIGLGGVWNFRSSTDGYFLLPEMEKINWCRRTVYICYDSDYATNSSIVGAINRLTEELMERGALPYVIMLPSLDDENKTGLDDFLMQAEDGRWQDLVNEAESVTIARHLWSLNKEVVYVEDPGLVIAMENSLKLTPAAFGGHSRWSTLSVGVPTMGEDGEVKLKKEKAADNWLKWPFRKAVKKVTYAPGEPRITEDNFYNQWSGWGVTPRKGDVAPFLKLMKFLFKDMEPDAMEYVLDWLAYPIQNPGVKMFTAVMIWGVEEGTGKSLIGYTMGRIYGTNFKELTDEDLESDYTAWAENKQFVMGDEITGTDNRKFANKLKRLITQRSMTVNIKHVAQYDVPDCINYLFTSNSADAFFLSDKDRRNVIIEVVGPPMEEAFYTKVYDKWLWGTGPAALMDWLLERKISKKFDPSGRAPATAAKERMIMAGKGQLGGWVRELADHPGQVLRTGKLRHTRDMFTSGELLSFYLNKYPNDNKVTAIGLGKALSSAGFVQADNGRALRNEEGNMNRYYIVRNVDRWKRCSDRKKLETNLKSKPVVVTEGKV